MLVWSGKGILSVLVLIAGVVVFGIILPKEQFDYVLIISLFSAAAFSWFMGKKWNGEEGQIFIDKASGQEVAVRPNHSLFWIKMQYWGIIFSVFALIILVQQFA